MATEKKPQFQLNLFFLLFETLLGRYVTPSDTWIDTIENAARTGAVVFVLRNRNLFDFLCLRGVCKRHGLPVPHFVSGLATLFLRPVWTWIVRLLRPPKTQQKIAELHRVLDGNGSAVVFLRRPALRDALGSRPVEENGIQFAVTVQRRMSTPILAIPTVFLWGETPMKLAPGNLSFLFGTSEYPRLIRSIWLLIRRRSIHALISHSPVNIQQLQRDKGDDPQRLQAIVRTTANRHIELIRQQRLGSFKKPSSRVKAEVAASRRLRRELTSFADEYGVSQHEIVPRARKIIDRLATDFKPGILTMFAMVMSFIWKRLYTSIEIPPTEIDKIKAAVGRGPLLLLPCHRSHVDYLAISEAMNTANIMLPHIAAGDNLAFWPMGFLFRSAGAFFIRRKFVDDQFYRAVVNAYIRRLVHEGYTIEVFIEGGRSRTGKLAPPKLGMIEMALDAISRETRRPLGILPIFIGYDKVIEEDAYLREAIGKKKKKENLGSLLKSARALVGKWGKLYVRAGDFVTVDDLLHITNCSHRDLQDVARRREVAQEIGEHTLRNINDNAIITVRSVMSTAILGMQSQFHIDEVLTRARRLCHLIRVFGGTLCRDLEETMDSPAAATTQLAEHLDILITEKRIIPLNRAESGLRATLFQIKAQARYGFDFYKNALVHLFVAPALVGTAFESSHNMSSPLTETNLHDHVTLATALYRGEFLLNNPRHYPQWTQKSCTRAIERLVNSGAIEHRGDGYVVADRHILQCIIHIMRPFFEAYHCALLATRARHNTPSVTAFRIANNLFNLHLDKGTYHMPEAHNKLILQSAFTAIKTLRLNRPQIDEHPFDNGGLGDQLLTWLTSAVNTPLPTPQRNQASRNAGN